MDENDETINHDGNLLRSIIVTEVKMRPKPPQTTTIRSPLFVPPPPPPPLPTPKQLDENEITDDFRRSIDAALRGLEAVYHTSTITSSPPPSEQVQQTNIGKPAKRAVSPPPLVLQYGVTNAPLPKSISKEQTSLPPDVPPPPPVDHTVNLAVIIRQMAEQQKFASEHLSKDVHDEGLIQSDIHPRLGDDTNELMMDAVEITTRSQIDNPIPPLEYATAQKSVTVIPNGESQEQIERIVKEIKEHGDKFESKESLPAIVTATKQPSSYSLGLTSPLQAEPIITSSTTSPLQPKAKLRSENRPKSFIANEEVPSKDHYKFIKQLSLDELAHLTQTGLSNPNLTTTTTKLGISTSSGKIEEEEHTPKPLTKMPTSISQIIEEHRTILDEPSSTTSPPQQPPIVTPIDTHIRVKSPSHNVTYTEIIHSESRDGEQSRRFITETYDEQPSNEDEQTTTLKVITKSEFSNHPTLGEKIMEQSVQVITVKVRNETIKTTIQQASLPSTTDNGITYERRPVSELVKNFEVVAAANGNSVST